MSTLEPPKISPKVLTVRDIVHVLQDPAMLCSTCPLSELRPAVEQTTQQLNQAKGCRGCRNRAIFYALYMRFITLIIKWQQEHNHNRLQQVRAALAQRFQSEHFACIVQDKIRGRQQIVL